jgi:hypothetical protein
MGRNQRIVFAIKCLDYLISKCGEDIGQLAGINSLRVFQELSDNGWRFVPAGGSSNDHFLDEVVNKIEQIPLIDWHEIPNGLQRSNSYVYETYECALLTVNVLRSSSPGDAAKTAVCAINKVYSDILWDEHAPPPGEEFDDQRMKTELARQAALLDLLESDGRKRGQNFL